MGAFSASTMQRESARCASRGHAGGPRPHHIREMRFEAAVSNADSPAPNTETRMAAKASTTADLRVCVHPARQKFARWCPAVPRETGRAAVRFRISRRPYGTRTGLKMRLSLARRSRRTDDSRLKSSGLMARVNQQTPEYDNGHGGNQHPVKNCLNGLRHQKN